MPRRTRRRKSLHQLHPWRIDAPLGVFIALLTIIVGLSLPVMSIRKLVFWKDSYSIVEGALGLYVEGYVILGVIIFTFSVVFPTLKLSLLGALWFTPLTVRSRRALLWLIKVLGRWSMLDVFVVAVFIVASMSKAFLSAKPGPGLYVFTAGVLLSMAATLWIDLIAGRERR